MTCHRTFDDMSLFDRHRGAARIEQLIVAIQSLV